jgi:hypothetical protein
LDQVEAGGGYLSFEKDDIVAFSDSGTPEGWCKGELVHTSSPTYSVGMKGIFPVSYVNVLPLTAGTDLQADDIQSLLKVQHNTRNTTQHNARNTTQHN